MTFLCRILKGTVNCQRQIKTHLKQAITLIHYNQEHIVAYLHANSLLVVMGLAGASSTQQPLKMSGSSCGSNY